MNPQGGNKMAEMPVKNLLLNMGAPMMISMLGQALYNVVDTFLFLTFPIRRRSRIWATRPSMR